MAKRAGNIARGGITTARKGSGKSAGRNPKATAAAASSGLILDFIPQVSLLGSGFGIDQSVFLGTIDIRLPEEVDLDPIESLLGEFALAPFEQAPASATMSRETRLVARILELHAAIQRAANIPVFGSARLLSSTQTKSGARRIAFAAPSYARRTTIATIEFMIEAVTEQTRRGRSTDAVLQRLRDRFKALLAQLLKDTLTGANPSNFIEAAHRLGVEHHHLMGRTWVYGLGRHRKYLNSSVTSVTPHLSVSYARDKITCGALLRAAGLPVAMHGLAETADAAVRLGQRIGYPVVVKPADSDAGAGVTAGITDEADLRRAYEIAAETSARIMVERHQDGSEYRVTVVHGKVVRAWVRRAGGVVGDGVHTVAQLIDQFNAEPRNRIAEMLKQKPVLALGEEASAMLQGRDYTADTVPPAGEFVALRRRANISAGGTYQLIPPESLHADNRALAINAAVAVGLDIAGVDIISGDPTISWRETGGIICEVNASPQLGYGQNEPIYGEILTAVLGGNGRIPVHLAVLQPGLRLPGSLEQLAGELKCNAAAGGTDGWIEGAGRLGPFADVLRASWGVLFDRRVAGALIVMKEEEAVRFGLPAAHFTSIRLIGHPDWSPSPLLLQLIEGHSLRIVRQSAAAAAN